MTVGELRSTLPVGYFRDNVGIDVMIAMACPLTRCFVSFPPLVVTRNEVGKSTVQR